MSPFGITVFRNWHTRLDSLICLDKFMSNLYNVDANNNVNTIYVYPKYLHMYTCESIYVNKIYTEKNYINIHLYDCRRITLKKSRFFALAKMYIYIYMYRPVKYILKMWLKIRTIFGENWIDSICSLVKCSSKKIKSRENTCWVRERTNRSWGSFAPRKRNSINDPKPWRNRARLCNERLLLYN